MKEHDATEIAYNNGYADGKRDACKCITVEKLDEIFANLANNGSRKKDMKLAVAQKEIEAINREADAYWDGLYDAFKAVKSALPIQPEEDSNAKMQ